MSFCGKTIVIFGSKRELNVMLWVSVVCACCEKMSDAR